MTPDRIWAWSWDCASEQDQYRASPYIALHGPTIQAVRKALAEACEEVEAAVKAEHGWPDVHPAVQHRFDRDMSVVAGWREALTKLDGKG